MGDAFAGIDLCYAIFMLILNIYSIPGSGNLSNNNRWGDIWRPNAMSADFF